MSYLSELQGLLARKEAISSQIDILLANTLPPTKPSLYTAYKYYLNQLEDALAQIEQTILEGIPVSIGVGQGDGSPNNLYVDIYAIPNETLESLGSLTKMFGSDGMNYVGNNQVLNLTITGLYKARDSIGNFRFWYRVEFLSNGQPTVGWISDNNRVFENEVLVEAGMAWIRENKPSMDDPSILPERDRDGTLVYTFYYNSTLFPMLYAPLQGNISLVNLQIGILRARAFAVNSVHLGGAFHFFQVRIHYLDTTTQQWAFVEDWTEENRLLPAEVQNALQVLTVDRTSEYAQQFDLAVSEGRIPEWEMPPRFSFYPLSIAQTCASGQPPTAANIDGLGVPPTGYGTPPYHPGTDFYAPEGSYVYSIAPNGLVVGIGAGNSVAPNRVDNTAYDWGSAILDDKRGYSVIVRYGHLYVLYGHLTTLEPTIFVGAPLAAGDRIGRIGRFNDPHVHIEVRNFNSPLDPEWFQDNSLYDYGFITFDVTQADDRALHHYDLAQFFSTSVTAWLDDAATSTQTVTGFISTIADDAQINLGDCTRTFQVKMDLQTVQDSALNVAVRGLVQGTSNQSLLIAPSAVPDR